MTIQKNRQFVAKHVDEWIAEGQANGDGNGYSYAVGCLESNVTSILSLLEDENPNLYRRVIDLHFPEKEKQ